MNFRILVGVLTVLLIGNGCATYQVSGIPSAEQRFVYRDGRQTIISQKESSVVAVAVKEETVSGSDRLEFVVAVNNLAPDEIIFSTENISATASNLMNPDSSELHVYTNDELVAEEKKRRTWQAIAVALGGVADSMNAANAGYSNTYGTYSGSTYSNYGTSYNTYGTYSATTYDYGAAQAARDAANARTNAEMARIGAEGKAALEELSSTILKVHTVFPGEWHGGVIQVDSPSGTAVENMIDLHIDFGEDEHSFRFNRAKVQKTYPSNSQNQTE